MPDPINLWFDLPFFAAAFFGGYMLGSIPTGLFLTRFGGAGDIRKIGSGNIGATNALRTGKKWIGIGTLIGDIGKAALAVYLAQQFGKDMAVIAAVGAFFGHLFPVWLGFRGGKGVSVFIGLLAVLYWPLAVSFALVWLAVAALFRFSSLAALAAATATPFAAWMFDERQIAEVAALLLLFIFWAHRDNIKRLARGSEPKIGGKQNGETKQ